MAITQAEMQILITAKSEADKVLSQVAKQMSAIGDAADKQKNPLKAIGDHLTGLAGAPLKAVAGVTDALGAIGLAGMGAATVFNTVSGAVEGLIGPAADAQKVSAQLDAVLASTGGKAGVTRDQVLSLSDSLSKMTAFDDEAITSAQSLLLTFTGIGGDIMPQATQAVLDMSQALGQDLKSSSIEVGKALNDPVQGATALRRVGVSLTQAQEDLIKSLVASGDAAGAQAVILNELQTEFGGAAKAAGETFAGKLTILKTQLGNVQEAIGGPLIDVLGKLITQITPVVTLLAEALPGALEDFEHAMAPVIDVVEELGGIVDDVFAGDFAKAGAALQDTLTTIGTGLLDKLQEWSAALLGWIGPLIPPFVAELGKLAAAAFQWVLDNAGPLGEQFRAWALAAVDWVLDAAKQITPQLLSFLGDVLDWLTENGPTLAQKFLSEWLPAAIVWVAQAAIDIIPKLAQLLLTIGEWIVTTGVPKLNEFAIKMGVAIIEGTVAGLANLGAHLLDAIGEVLPVVAQAAKDLGNAIVAGMVKGITGAAGQVSGAVRTMASNAIDAAKKELGIASPSRAFQEIGRNVDDGLIRGLRGNLPLVQDAAEDVAGVVAQAADVVTKTWGQASSDLKERQLEMSDSLTAVADAHREMRDESSEAIIQLILTYQAWNEQQDAIAKAAQDATAAIGGQTSAVLAQADAFSTLAAKVAAVPASTFTNTGTKTSGGAGSIPEPSSSFKQAIAAQVPQATDPNAPGFIGFSAINSDPALRDLPRNPDGSIKASAVPKFAGGGIMPGPLGAAGLAILHGGEGVFRPDQMAALGGGIDYEKLAAAIARHSHPLLIDGVQFGRATSAYTAPALDRFARIQVP